MNRQQSAGVSLSAAGFVSLILFVLTIPAGNWAVTHVGLVCEPNGPCLIPVWPGVMSPSAVLLAGLALVLRDAVQNLLGNVWTLVAIAAGAFISALLAEPSVVLGSTVAFLFSELADFAVYTPMRGRHPSAAVILSGLVGSMVDSAIFLSLAFGSLDFLFGQVLGIHAVAFAHHLPVLGQLDGLTNGVEAEEIGTCIAEVALLAID